MPMLNKQDICASFQDIELCALLKSKDLCPIMLQKMLEKLYIQCIVNRVNKASLIEEAKVHRIKNYTRISKEDLCIQLWNHEEYINPSNMKTTMTLRRLVILVISVCYSKFSVSISPWGVKMNPPKHDSPGSDTWVSQSPQDLITG